MAKPRSAQKQHFEGKWKIKNLLGREEKLQVTVHIFFSRQIEHKMLLLITVHPFALKVVGGQPETFRSK